MGVVCVASQRPGVGKTALAAALVALSARAGKEVTYLRPRLEQDLPDPDTPFIHSLLPGQATGTEAVTLPPGASSSQESLLLPVEASAREATARGWNLLVEVPNLNQTEVSPWDHCLRIAQMAGGQVVAIVEYTPDMDAHRLGSALTPLKGSLRGVLVNRAPRYRAAEAVDRLGTEALGSPLLGVLAEDRMMMAPTVAQLVQHLGAQWVLGQEGASNLVCRILIGGNIMDSGETYFGRHQDQAVVIRGDRPDIQLAALASPLACLVLTGGHQPIPYVYHEAQQREVSLLVVKEGTIATAESLGALQQRAMVHHLRKVDRFLRLLEENGAAAPLTEALA